MDTIKRKIEFLSGFMLPQRFEHLQKVLSQRTRYLTVCLENIYQDQNASAVLRSCDAIGIQDVHIIETSYNYRINKEIALGSDKWLDLHRYSKDTPTGDVIGRLRSQGYRIVATTPREDALSLNDFDVRAGKTALFFGTELTGLSDAMLQQADEYLHIPMYGFTESFNISVSASIILYNLAERMRQSKLNWQLSEEEYSEILLRWLQNSIKSSESLLAYLEKTEKQALS